MSGRGRLGCVVAVLLAALIGAGGAGASARARFVGLVVPGHRLAAGHEITVRFVNHGSAPLLVALCSTLQRREGRAWVTVTHSHGVTVACPPRNVVGGEVEPGSYHRLSVSLYDDLSPGSYRLTLPYRAAGARRSEPPFTPDSSPLASVAFTVSAFDPGPEPTLSQSRLLSTALRVAGQGGDSHPALVQAAEGIHAEADVIATDTLPDEWNWSYLVAMRGDFTPHISTPPGIPMGPGPVVRTEHVITLVLNARTGAVTDFGISDRYPELARLGSVSTLSG